MRERTAVAIVVAVPLVLQSAVLSSTLAKTSGGSLDSIQHIVVLMQENRSFDHYFGQLPVQGQPAVAGEPANASNPNPLAPAGPPITAFLAGTSFGHIRNDLPPADG